MRKYESVVVFDHMLGDTRIKAEIKKIQGILEAQGAEEIKIDHWGRKEIPHIPGRFTKGDYVAYNFSGKTSDLIEKFEGLLKITEGVKNFQTHLVRQTQRKFKGNPKATARGPISDDDYGDNDF